MTQGPTDVASPRVGLRELAARLPQVQVRHLLRLALAEGHTVDRATGEVVAVLVASGELEDSMQLRAVVGTWCALVAAQRRPVARVPPVRRTVAVNVARDQSPEEPIELPAEMVEPLTTDEQTP